jgi:hypothetical protein
MPPEAPRPPRPVPAALTRFIFSSRSCCSASRFFCSRICALRSSRSCEARRRSVSTAPTPAAIGRRASSAMALASAVVSADSPACISLSYIAFSTGRACARGQRPETRACTTAQHTWRDVDDEGGRDAQLHRRARGHVLLRPRAAHTRPACVSHCAHAQPAAYSDVSAAAGAAAAAGPRSFWTLLSTSRALAAGTAATGAAVGAAGATVCARVRGGERARETSESATSVS